MTFSAELKQAAPAAIAILDAANISARHFRHHLRYISRWGADRRRLLAAGANFQLLEGLNEQDQAGLLSGLELSGTILKQRQALAEHLGQRAVAPEGLGWLAPTPSAGRSPRLYDARNVAWVYPSREVEFSEGLHPSVARSLIARYVPSPGVVVDPMAGSGLVALTATQLGHHAWASDIAPAAPFIRPLDLMTEDLGMVLGEEHRQAADLLVLHPPLPQTLGLSQPRYTDWLKDILEHCWGAVRDGGCLTLIVPVTAEVPVLARAEVALRDSASDFFDLDVEELTASHLAVARDGGEGWHLLVWRTPTADQAEGA